MKNFTLHFDKADQCDSLDRSWFGEMWLLVANLCIRSKHPCLKILQILISNLDKMSQNCAFRDDKFETQHMHYLIVERHMFYFQDICFPKELDLSKSQSI